MSFVHLHLHTEYSLLDSVIRVPDLVSKIKDLKMPAVAMSDHGVMLGLYPFWNECKQNDIKPIIACEVYLSRSKYDDRTSVLGKMPPYHFLLIAETQEGYHNLVKLVSEGHLNGFYRKPRVDKELLKKYSKGLIATSACLGGELAKKLSEESYESAKAAALEYQEIFGKENFFVEIQRNGIDKQEQVNPDLIKIAREIDAGLVATCDSHYLEQEDAKLQEIMWAISDGKKMTDENRRKAWSDQFYVKSSEEMEILFADLPEAVENTGKIANRCENIQITFDRVEPLYWAVPEGETAQEMLVRMTYEGAKTQYGEMTPELKARIDYELKIIHDKGYDDYFLIVGDVMQWARRNGIVVSVRGSASGAVVAYCLDIINVEPIRWQCYFERFLNPERPSPPDIDIDIQDDRREEFVDYIADKYGAGFCAIGTIGKMKTKAAIKDIGRVLDIELSITEKLSKLVHVKFGKPKTILKMIEDDAEFAAIIDSDARLKNELVPLVHKAEGLARHISTHACGHLVTPKAITDYIPVQMETGTRGRVITQVEGAHLEDLGFMKFDFLGLRNLTIINNIIASINENKKAGEKDLHYKDIPFDDAETFVTFSEGRTTGVFQFESSGMKKYLRDLQPTTVDDICFMAAAYRPGPMEYIPDYILCKKGLKKPSYLVPELETIVGNTYGFAIYQEQIIKICVEIAGYSMGGADLLRRAMGKKKMKIMDEQEPIFKKGVMDKGYSQAIADELWNYLLPFANYGFNKAHAASYSIVAYWTAYLKTHYPVDFLAGLLRSDIQDIDRIAIDIAEARDMGVEVLAPDLNESYEYFRVVSYGDKEKNEAAKIRFGLKAIKNLGEGVIQAMIIERKENGFYTSLEDLLLRVHNHELNKRSLDALAKAGALDNLIAEETVLGNMDNIVSFIKSAQAEANTNQMGLFGAAQLEKPKLLLTDQPPLPIKQKLAWEREYLGLYVSSHPLGEFQNYLKKELISYSSFAEYNNESIGTIGLVNKIKKIITKKGDPMLFVQIQNPLETMEVTVFPRVYQESQEIWIEDVPVFIKGKVNIREGEVSLLVDQVAILTEGNLDIIKNNLASNKVKKGNVGNAETSNIKKIILTMEEVPAPDLAYKLKEIFEAHPGNNPVFLNINGKEYPTKTKVANHNILEIKITTLLGKNSFKVI